MNKSLMMYQIFITPLNPPRYIAGETGKSSPLPFTRGGLGWGKTVIKITG
jgi:hypothetical protein